MSVKIKPHLTLEGQKSKKFWLVLGIAELN